MLSMAKTGLPRMLLCSIVLNSFILLTGCASKTAPIDFAVRPLNPGGDITLGKSFPNKPVVLYCWATWCGPCKQFAPILNEMADQWQKKGIGFFAVAMDETAKVRAYEAKEPHRMTVGIDTRTAVNEVIPLPSLPKIVILDKEHRIIWEQEGFGPETEIEMARILESLATN